jgi:hypothetical protein
VRSLTQLREELRQRRHHREFRIDPPMWTETQRARLEDLLTAVRDAAPDEPQRPDEPPKTDEPQKPDETPRPDQTPGPDERQRAGGPEGVDGPESRGGHEGYDEAALATAVTNLWRAQRKLTAAGERPSPRDRQASRYLRTCTEALADAGLVVQDHDGDAFNPGRALEVLVYQENPALTAETVIETVRPSVYLHGRLVQMGQVIVGTPAQPVDEGNEHA